jgi:hypothetical protein
MNHSLLTFVDQQQISTLTAMYVDECCKDKDADCCFVNSLSHASNALRANSSLPFNVQATASNEKREGSGMVSGNLYSHCESKDKGTTSHTTLGRAPQKSALD